MNTIFNIMNIPILTFLITCLSACGNKETGSDPAEIKPQLDTISLISDPNFSQGLTLARANEPSPGSLNPYDTQTGKPIWNIAEWGTKYFLTQSDRNIIDDQIVYTNQGKTIKFQKLPNGMEVGMTVTTSKEYDRPRQANESWPHLLVEQEFSKTPYIKDLKKLILKFNGRLVSSERMMTDDEYNTGLHAAQFQLFITVQNRNKNSAYYGDFLWFGIPFYDNRNELIPLYAAQDIGKGDATGKFIYSIGSTDLMSGTFHDKNWHNIEKDIYPHILKALELAKKRGYLTGSFLEEFQLSGMNLGWEVPGTFDVDFEYNGFDILAVSEK